jgi:hypothetical protein
LKNHPVRFGVCFISKKPKKPNRTETGKKPSQNRKKLGQNRKKPSQTGLNLFYPKKLKRIEPKPVGLTWFQFLKKQIDLVTFFYKNRTEPKMITPNNGIQLGLKFALKL